jgi:integrating conjugative element protein (TIGR03756 family)
MKSKLLNFVMILVLIVSTPARSDEFGINDLVQGFAADECLDYCIVGVCFWLVGICPFCEIETTAKIQHRLPDLVVSAYKLPGENPWNEARNVYGEFALDALRDIQGDHADGSATVYSTMYHDSEEKSSVAFNEVQIVGNPVAYVSESTDYLCDTESDPIPYFMSELDATAWRNPILEGWHIESYTPGMRELWPMGGSVFPRVGYLKSYDPPKAAAVMAQRAIDITLQTWQLPHLYIPFGYGKINPDLDNVVSDPSSTDAGPDGMECAGTDSETGLWSFNVDSVTPEFIDYMNSLVQTGDEGAGSEELTRMRGDPCADNQADCSSSGGFWDGVSCQLQQYIYWLEPGLERERAWQMISPVQQNYCESFIEVPDDWSDDKQTDEYTFGWQYWRKYKCCVPNAGIFLGSVEFEPICVIGSNDY